MQENQIELTSTLKNVPLSIIYSTPALLPYAEPAIQNLLQNFGEQHITSLRLKSLKVSNYGFGELNENVLDAIRGRGPISVTPQVCASLRAMSASRPKNTPWSQWKPSKVFSVADDIKYWLGPIEFRDLHRLEMVDGVIVSSPPSKFLDAEINATFTECWVKNGIQQAIVAVSNTGSKKGEQKMTVVSVTVDGNAIEVLEEMGCNLAPIGDGTVPSKSLLYSENGRLEGYYTMKSSKRKVDDEAPLSPAKIPAVDENYSDSE